MRSNFFQHNNNNLSLSCWILYDHGKIGTLNQCLGLAEAMGLNATIKPLIARLPWRWLPPTLWPFSLQYVKQINLLPPWPNVIIAGGRVSAIPAATIRRLNKGDTKVIQLLNPCIHPSHFDAIITPQHDQLTGHNVLHTVGPFHRVTSQRLLESAQVFQPQLANLSGPRLAVLIGGSNSCFRLDQQVMAGLAEQLRRLVLTDGYSLMISVSRRTDTKLTEFLRQQLLDLSVHFWDGHEPNPYFAYLSLADKIMVTGDSISMITEAAATGKPVYIYRLPGHSKKFERFYQTMESGHHCRFFTNPLVPYTPHVLDDYVKIIPKLKNLLGIYSH